MKNILQIIFTIAIGFALSCSDEEPALRLVIEPSQSYLLPGDDYKCGEIDKSSGYRAFWSRLKIQFRDYGKTLYIVSMKVKFKANSKFPGGNCFIGNSEVDYMYDMDQGVFQTSAYYAVSSDQTYAEITNTRCALKCFGMAPGDEDKGFAATGEVKIIAYSIDVASGEQLPYTAKVPLTITYSP